MTIYQFIEKYDTKFSYVVIDYYGKAKEYTLRSEKNHFTFKVANNQSLQEYINQYDLHIGSEDCIQDIAHSLAARYHCEISIMMLRFLLSELAKPIKGRPIAKICEIYNKEEWRTFITYIHKPIFSAAPGYNTHDVFDYISIDMNVSTMISHEYRMIAVRHFRKEIISGAFDEIKHSYRFNEYGIPIEYIKLDRMTLLKSNGTLNLLFSVKGLPRM